MAMNHTIYQDKAIFKSKGSGVALYVHEKFNCSISNYSICNKNIESLFITITNTPEPITVGVIYRPPSGLKQEFTAHLQTLLDKLPCKNVYMSISTETNGTKNRLQIYISFKPFDIITSCKKCLEAFFLLFYMKKELKMLLLN